MQKCYLKPGGDIWLFENHWEGEFMTLRGADQRRDEEAFQQQMRREGFEPVCIVKTNFCFPSLAETQRLLGFILGTRALRYLERHSQALSVHGLVRIEHLVSILHYSRSINLS
jgi:hypothetical protein